MKITRFVNNKIVKSGDLQNIYINNEIISKVLYKVRARVKFNSEVQIGNIDLVKKSS